MKTPHFAAGFDIESIDWQKSDGLIPAIVQDQATSKVLMLGYVNRKSLEMTLQTGHMTFFSRSRQKLWVKGESSGHFLNVVGLAIDCDHDTILVQAVPHGPTCHLGTASCFDSEKEKSMSEPLNISFLNDLTRVIEERFAHPDESSSYVAKLIKAGPDRMAQKVGEEAVETVIASKNADLQNFEGEAADLLFHLMVLLKAKGSSLAALSEVLRGRHQKSQSSGKS